MLAELIRNQKNKGVTLTELLIVVIIVGILAAVAVPSFVGMFSRYKIEEGLEEIEGALKEAQKKSHAGKQAM